MKRTSKWMKTLTMKELRHMRESRAMTLSRFRLLRKRQAVLKAQMIEFNGGVECGTLTEPCWDCRLIESKLKEAGAM